MKRKDVDCSENKSFGKKNKKSVSIKEFFFIFLIAGFRG